MVRTIGPCIIPCSICLERWRLTVSAPLAEESRIELDMPRLEVQISKHTCEIGGFRNRWLDWVLQSRRIGEPIGTQIRHTKQYWDAYSRSVPRPTWPPCFPWGKSVSWVWFSLREKASVVSLFGLRKALPINVDSLEAGHFWEDFVCLLN